MNNDEKKTQVLWIDDEIYEDEQRRRSVWIDQLQAKGDIEVHAAIDGSEALDYLHEHHPDIIVLDIMVPPGEALALAGKDIKNGYETGFVLLRIIRLTLRLTIPVIVLTLYPKLLPENERRELDIAEYLAKPIKMKSLAELIRFHAKET